MRLETLFSVRKQIVLSLAILFSISLNAQVFFNDLESDAVSGNWIGLQTIDSGYAYSGNFYSSVDANNPYGLGIEQFFPEQVSGRNLNITISGFVRSNDTENRAIYVFTLVDSTGQTKLWKGINLSGYLKDSSSWHYFEETFKIPANHTLSTKVKAYLWSNNSKSYIHLDDLKFEFEIINNPTFVPDIIENKEYDNSYELVFANSWYSVFIGSENTIVLAGNDNTKLINNIRYYTLRELQGNRIEDVYELKFEKVEANNKETNLEFQVKEKWGSLKLLLICNNLNGSIEFAIGEKYRRKQNVFREALVIDYAIPVSEVYRQNRKVDSDNFKDEYWLDKQGVLFSDRQQNMSLYHTNGISSLQLIPKKDQLFVNLDYFEDHPFFRFPLEPDSTDWRLEESFSKYKNDSRQFSFGLNINTNVSTLPRFMKNPAGYLSTYIWTEHADFTNIRTNRAVYFGNENITDADSATGGFVYYDIPVTKSVFYDNPDSVTNTKASFGLFNGQESAIKTDSEYEDYLDQISAIGHDICLHTPDHYTTTPQLLEEALSFIQNKYNSPSWIDHGNNNGPENNREDLICDATLKKSSLYSIDLWDEYGVKYLHNAYHEELNTFGNWQFESSLEKPYSGFGDFFPKPDYYQHPTLSKGIYHWSTSSALFISEDYLWNYLFNKDKLNNMVNNWYVEINHVYPAWVDPKKGMWKYDTDSTIIAHPGLNMTLQNLSELRDNGKLNVTTIADHLDYRTATDNVDYEVLVDGRIKITNSNQFKIRDLSMAVNANAVTVNGLIPSHKTVGDDIIFWFDMDAGESKLIRVIK